jgi:hypothetical protein
MDGLDVATFCLSTKKLETKTQSRDTHSEFECARAFLDGAFTASTHREELAQSPD